MIPSGSRSRRRPLLLRAFILFAVAACSISAFGQRLEVIAIEPDIELQAKIEEIVQVMGELAGPDAKREMELAVQGLVSAANGNRQDVMLQTLSWASHAIPRITNDEVVGIVYYVFQSLSFSDVEIFEMALPYLTEMTPYPARNFLRQSLGRIYVKRDDRGSTIYDFSFFAERIANDSDRDPREYYGLIDYLYMEDPREAVLTLMRVHGASDEEIAAMKEGDIWLGRLYRRATKRTRNPEWDLNKAEVTLDQYSRSEHWWLRLYAAALLEEVKTEIAKTKDRPAQQADMIMRIEEGTIRGKIAKDLIVDMVETGKDPKALVEEKGLVQITDTDQLERIVRAVIEKNPGPVADITPVKKQSIGYLVGSTMKAPHRT